MSIEININCDLGEKSKHHSNKHDPDLLEIVNSANIACGYHAGDEETMNNVVEISKKNGVSIGAHPSFNDPENFGRERMNLSSSEIEKLIIDQYEILQTISSNHGENVTHIKPHGALNNMACEDIDLATTLAKVIKSINPHLIYLVPTGSKMEQAAKKLDMNIGFFKLSCNDMVAVNLFRLTTKEDFACLLKLSPKNISKIKTDNELIQSIIDIVNFLLIINNPIRTAELQAIPIKLSLNKGLFYVNAIPIYQFPTQY